MPGNADPLLRIRRSLLAETLPHDPFLHALPNIGDRHDIGVDVSEVVFKEAAIR